MSITLQELKKIKSDVGEAKYTDFMNNYIKVNKKDYVTFIELNKGKYIKWIRFNEKKKKYICAGGFINKLVKKEEETKAVIKDKTIVKKVTKLYLSLIGAGKNEYKVELKSLVAFRRKPTQKEDIKTAVKEALSELQKSPRK